MDKEEILERSRRENEILDEREWKFRGRMPTEVWAVYASMYGTNELIQYFRLRKISHLIFALLQLAMAVFFFGIFFMSLVR